MSRGRPDRWGLPLVEAPGEAAFYGPKLDVQVRDGRGHEESIATVQVDFVQPERFGLEYDAPDGSRRPVVMIHRGTVGSMERVVAALLERYQGRLPLWLAPVQVCVLPVRRGPGRPSPDALADDLLAAGLRARIWTSTARSAPASGSSRQRRDALIAVLGLRRGAPTAPYRSPTPGPGLRAQAAPLSRSSTASPRRTSARDAGRPRRPVHQRHAAAWSHPARV